MALVELARYPFAMNAQIARSFLESHGIGAVVFDSVMNAAESVLIMIPARLMVLDEDHADAARLLVEADLL